MALAAARPQDFDDDEFIQVEEPKYKTLEDAGILRMEMNQGENGQFQYAFETSDPIAVEAQGEAKQINDEVGMVMQGTYSFQTPDGQTISINWVADENGFQPQGDAIPVDTNSQRQLAAFDDDEEEENEENEGDDDRRFK